MKRPIDRTISKTGVLLLTLVMIGSLVVSIAPDAHAQCTALSSGECRLETHRPVDFEFTQSKTFWTVVGVVPTPGDDKDIYLFDGCLTGWGLAGSTGTSGTDFIVGDFNHNLLGTYYPQSLYGDTMATYNVYWNEGGSVFPIGIPVEETLGGSGSECNMIRVWDVFLEIGAEYGITWNPPPGVEANLAIFRNPGTEEYWAPRNDADLEVSVSGTTTYVAPADDWYGLVVFPTWDTSAPGNFDIEIEKLNDCHPLPAGICESHMIYTPATGPGDDFAFTQSSSHWAVLAVVPGASDTKTLELNTECDRNGTQLASSFTAGTGQTEFIVGDFNHTTEGTYFARVAAGQSDIPFAIEFDSGADIFHVPGEITGTMEGLIGSGAAATVWDVYLEAGKQYEFRYNGWGEKNPHAALFRNPGTNEYWGGRQDAEWEISGSVYHHYTAPQTDWYGLVVFANDQSESSSGYEILIQEIGDCQSMMSDECAEYAGWPREFSLHQDDDFWAVVAVIPSDDDHKTLSLMTQCDLGGTNLAQATTGRTQIIVGDFNHNPLGTYYPTVTGGDASAPYTIQSDTGKDPVDDIFPRDQLVTGSVGGASGECGLVRIWDIWLSAGKTYDIGFTTNFDADVRLALFRNPGNGAYWGTNSDSEFELSESGNYEYTSSVADWYGLVVFTNTKDAPGDYTLWISKRGATAVENGPAIPQRFALHQNAPNPFNPSTVIRYDVPAGGARVSLTVYDVNGRLVRSLVDAVESPGKKSITWNGTDDRGSAVATGVYFYRLTASGNTHTRKMLLMK